MAITKQAINMINAEDAEHIIQDSTNKMQGFSTKQKEAILTKILINKEVAFGCLYFPWNTDDTHVQKVLQCRDIKDVQYVHLIEWFEIDFIYYIKKEKKLIVFGDSANKVEDTIIFVDDKVQQYTMDVELEKKGLLEIQNRRDEKADYCSDIANCENKHL